MVYRLSTAPSMPCGKLMARLATRFLLNDWHQLVEFARGNWLSPTRQI